jgi:hypothetical protein
MGIQPTSGRKKASVMGLLRKALMPERKSIFNALAFPLRESRSHSAKSEGQKNGKKYGNLFKQKVASLEAIINELVKQRASDQPEDSES